MGEEIDVTNCILWNSFDSDPFLILEQDSFREDNIIEETMFSDLFPSLSVNNVDNKFMGFEKKKPDKS